MSRIKTQHTLTDRNIMLWDSDPLSWRENAYAAKHTRYSLKELQDFLSECFTARFLYCGAASTQSYHVPARVHGTPQIVSRNSFSVSDKTWSRKKLELFITCNQITQDTWRQRQVRSFMQQSHQKRSWRDQQGRHCLCISKSPAKRPPGYIYYCFCKF